MLTASPPYLFMFKVNLSNLWSAHSWGQRDSVHPSSPATGVHKCTASAHIRTSLASFTWPSLLAFVSTNRLPVWELSGIVSVSTSRC